jgi:phosphotransferase system enzyme I (PtsI)
MASLGQGEARIFDAHLLVLEDNALLDEVAEEVRSTGKNIEFCYNQVAQRYISFFSSMEDEYLRERVSDISDVSRRLLHNLIGMKKVTLGQLAAESVIISEDISPSDAADLDRGKLLGFVTDAGGKTSHLVIMARSLRIPAVVGTHDATVKVASGDHILVDGYEGIVVINPSEKRLFLYGKQADERKKRDDAFQRAIGEPSCTLDGVSVQLMANVEGLPEMEEVSKMRAQGVGLFRTEGVFLRHHGFPPESVQFEEYKSVVEAAAGQPVIIRTLDTGGDKTIGDEAVEEDVSFMGSRAIRFCLDNKAIFKTQLRAILRASVFGDVKMMFPMISGIEELRAAKQVLEEVKVELREEKTAFREEIEVGAMVEVPSAAMIVDLLAAETDFLSIGTNDLIQYMIAVDRLNDAVAHLYEPAHPAVVRILKQVIDGAKAADTPISICGEIAGDPLYCGLLVGMGADSLSLTSSSLPEVKYVIRHIRKADAQALVEAVMATPNVDDVVRSLEDFRKKALGKLA